MISGQPNNVAIIKQRAALLSKIREFFKQEKVLEVDTPLLCTYAATAMHIDPFICLSSKDFKLNNINDKNMNHNYLKFLQTSPEYAMKRLLAAGSEDIFQICKAFRADEIGNLHNPEFTILEWYRLGIDHHQLMENVGNLLNFVLSINIDSEHFNAINIHSEPKDLNIDISINKHDIMNNYYKIYKKSYREIFIKYVDCDPITSSLNQLKKLIIDNINLSKEFFASLTKQDCQELLFNHFVEPNLLGDKIIWFIYDYPVEQAALAKISTDSNNLQVAQRFEVYINGIELANGYHELLDVNLQLQRFTEDQLRRKTLGKFYIPIDHYFIDALEHGLPACSGVALGIDRLLMLQLQAKTLQEVILFPWGII